LTDFRHLASAIRATALSYPKDRETTITFCAGSFRVTCVNTADAIHSLADKLHKGPPVYRTVTGVPQFTTIGNLWRGCGSPVGPWDWRNTRTLTEKQRQARVRAWEQDDPDLARELERIQ
jgi:hypothetical protein